jgi:hypothetical protein
VRNEKEKQARRMNVDDEFEDDLEKLSTPRQRLAEALLLDNTCQSSQAEENVDSTVIEDVLGGSSSLV